MLTKSLNTDHPLDYYHHNANDRYGFKTRKQTDEIRVYKFILNIEYNCT